MGVIKDIENALVTGMNDLERKQEHEFKTLWEFLDKKSEEID